MRITVPCYDCTKGGPPGQMVLVDGELDDAGVVYVECPKKHRSAVVFNARRHEILIRSGAKALLQGFASESIFSMHAALERAYEFYIRAVCRHHNVPADQFEAAWKDNDYSERQLGAFAFLYLQEVGQFLPLDKKKITEVRNRVIHKGHIATESEARKFGEAVFRRIRDIERALDRFPEAVKAEKAHQLDVQRKSIPPDIAQGTLEVLSVLVQDGKVTGPTATFEEYLSALQEGIRKGTA